MNKVDKNCYFITDANDKPQPKPTKAVFIKENAIAEKRTHRFALALINPSSNVTIKQMLAAAYMQGISDAVTLN